ncbi:MAG: winged helix-turn-helix transcriptional regulator [Alphaproteobacteria bacterium]|nr:winged helix-turn-helix transcriptional regulator [Alphaproteobacteria bacterium]
MRRDAGAILADFCRMYEEIGANFPIRNSEMNVMKIICSTVGPHTPVLLADMLGVSKPMVTTLINSLISQGFVAKIPSPEDGRSFYVMPTKRGRALFDKFRAERDDFLSQIKSRLGRADFDVLIDLIERVIDSDEN